jgi:hypothetical protein
MGGPNHVNILELFPCSGGFAEGFRRAGLTVSMAFDADPEACASYEANLGHAPVQMDVRDLLRMLEVGWRPAPVDLLLADPPCSPWSRAGKRLGTEDERDMLGTTVRIVDLLAPRAWLIANVPGLDDGPNWPTVQATIGRLSDRWCIDFSRLNAADYGWVDLCPKHADFAERLSVPTTVQGTAESIRRGPTPSAPISRASTAEKGSVGTRASDDASDATRDTWGGHGVRKQRAQNTWCLFVPRERFRRHFYSAHVA